MWDWLCQIDWGNAPSWVAVFVAATGAFFAYRSLRINRQNFAKQVEDSRVAQARLVWVLVDHVEPITAGSMSDPKALPEYPETHEVSPLINNRAIYEEIPADGFAVFRKDMTLFHVRVFNTSDQPITKIRLQTYGYREAGPGVRAYWEEGDLGSAFGTEAPGPMLPNTSARFRFVSPFTQVSRTGTRIGFIDSAGESWIRDGVSPPKIQPRVTEQQPGSLIFTLPLSSLNISIGKRDERQ